MGMQYIGEIRLFPFGFAPREWATCDGQLLPIQPNTALFSVIGTNYGGDGRTSFALPDLRGRVPLSFGQAPGLGLYDLGDQGGQEAVTLTSETVPPHQHAMLAVDARARNEKAPVNGSSIADSQGGPLYSSTTSSPTTMDPRAILPVGSADAPHGNMMPTLALEFCIALSGVFPSRE